MTNFMMLNYVLKRVPLDFDWEMDKVWKGYQNPFYKECSECNGTGYTEARRKLDEIVCSLMYCRTEGMQELLLGLTKKKLEDLGPIGFAGNDRYRVTLRIIKLAGLPKKWGWCSVCKGEGIDIIMQKKYDQWKPQEPPKGKGYQCWSTCGEGSPMSPVFKTLDDLCKWLAGFYASLHPKRQFTKKDWKDILQSDSPVVNIETGKIEVS